MTTTADRAVELLARAETVMASTVGCPDITLWHRTAHGMWRCVCCEREKLPHQLVAPWLVVA